MPALGFETKVEIEPVNIDNHTIHELITSPPVHKFRNLWHSFTEGAPCNTNTSAIGSKGSTASGLTLYDGACQTPKPRIGSRSFGSSRNTGFTPPRMRTTSAAGRSTAGKRPGKQEAVILSHWPRNPAPRSAAAPGRGRKP